MINAFTKARRSCSNPIVLFHIHVLPFPFNLHLISPWRWSNLQNLLFLFSRVWKSWIWTKSILCFAFHSFLLWSGSSFKSSVLKWTRAIIGRTRNRFVLFHIIFFLLVVFANPELMSRFIWFNVWDIEMRIVRSHSRCLGWQKLLFFIEKALISNFLFPGF